MSPPRFLIVRFSAIGDCVMAVPVASVIRRTHPNAFVAWAIEDRCAAVVDIEGLVNGRFEAARQTWKRRRWSLKTWQAQLTYYSTLRKFCFDSGMDLQGHSKTALCLRIAKPKHRLAIPGTDLVARRLNPIAHGLDPDMHCVDRNLQVLRSLGDFVSDAKPIMPALTEERAWVRSAIGGPTRLATITVAAGHLNKTVPMEHWHFVAEELLNRGYRVAFLGGEGDPRPDMANTVDWVAQLPWERTMAAVAESALHLCGDTGTGHIAAAYGVPVVSVFGHMNPARYRPYTEKAIVLREGTEARNVPPARIVEAFQTLAERYA